MVQLLRLTVLLVATLACACSGKQDSDPSTDVAAARDWNVVLIVLDTLRADGLGCYGNPLPISPRLDAFAAEGILFENAWAASPGTASSHASLFSSTYPQTHGVWNREMHDGEPADGSALSTNVVTLAESFRDAGFFTGAIADGGYVSAARGLDQGFDYFESFTRGGPAIFSHAGKWLQRHRKGDQPFFLFVHTYETHVPFVPLPADLELFAGDYQGPLRQAYEAAMEESQGNERKRKKQKTQEKYFRKLLHGDLTDADKEFYRALYHAEILLADRLVGELLDRLEELDLAQNTLVLVTSDHGEEFWEHGRHGHTQVYEELLHIPLIVRAPQGPRGVRRADALDHVDLMPTLLGTMGISLPPTAMGRDVGLLSPKSVAGPRWLVGQNNYPALQTAYRLDMDKLILYADREPAVELFDLESDPAETADRAADPLAKGFLQRARSFASAWRAEGVAWLQEHRLQAVPRGDSRQVPEQMQRELEQLGYAGED